VTETSLAARERARLADLLSELGPDAPTCCEGWTTAHLAAHTVVRDSRPDAMLGYGTERLPFGAPLSRWSHAVEDRMRDGTPYPELVGRVRSGPPAWSPVRLPVIDRLLNTSEFVIHHEDVRRAQPDWKPRALPLPDQDELWAAVTRFARAVRRPLVLRRSDATGVEVRAGGSAANRVVTGEPLEILLWLSGRRSVARVDVSERGDARP
jgi:uncharacterized protein (TIGR03085 family)